MNWPLYGCVIPGSLKPASVIALHPGWLPGLSTLLVSQFLIAEQFESSDKNHMSAPPSMGIVTV